MSAPLPPTAAVGGSSPRGFLITLAAVVALALLVPEVANRGVVFIAGIVMINAVYGMGFNLLFSTVGVLSFGQAAFFAAGAYTAALLMLRLDLPFLLVLGLTGVVGALIALAIGLLALRRTSGVYFAILTLAFGELLHILFAKNRHMGRNDGLPGIRRPEIELGPWTLNLTGDRYYYFIVVACAVLFAALWWISNSHLGRRFQAVRQDDTRAAFLGIDVARTRLLGFVLAGAITGIAGGLFAPWTQIVTPELAHWSNSAYPILFTLLGGAAFFWGPLVGAVVFAGIAWTLRAQVGATDVVTGLLLLAVVLAMPGGILGLLAAARARVAAVWTDRPLRRKSQEGAQ
ncbi:MAG: branched-chain amino acid ABC transporter permease [Alkalilacustris sp.]